MLATRLAPLGLLVTMLFTAANAPAAPRRFRLGSYDSDAYTLTFDSSGAFRYMRDQELMVQGEYVVHDTTIAVTDETGRDACVGPARNPGTYSWHVVHGALWFRTITDPCPDRIRGLADQAWRPHRAH